MSKCIAIVVAVALLFCITEKAYCFSLDNLKAAAQQVATAAAQQAASAAANKVSKGTSCTTTTTCTTTTNDNTNVPNQGPSFSNDDISNLASKIKTNVSSGDMMGIMNSPFHLIALQAPDIKFGQFFCLCGEGQLSLDQKKKIFGGSVVDPKGKWQTKIVSFNKTNEDTIAIELDLMMRNDPTESPKPSRRIFYFRYTSPGDTIYLIQIKAFGTKQGDIMINSDGASGYIGEQVFYTFYEGVMLFITSGQYQFNGT